MIKELQNDKMMQKCMVLFMCWYICNKTQKYYMLFKNTYTCIYKVLRNIKNMYTKFMIIFIARDKWLDMEGETSNLSIIYNM